MSLTSYLRKSCRERRIFAFLIDFVLSCFAAREFFYSGGETSMPNAKVLAEKQAVVDTLSDKLRGISGVLVDYSGITVAEDTEMRARMRRDNVDYTVIKNTLLRFAVQKVGLEGLEPLLSGTTSLAVSKDDAVAPAKVIKEYVGKLDGRFAIKGGFYNGKVISVAEVESLASIPPLPTLQAQFLGTLLAPITQLAVVTRLIAEKQGAPTETAAVAPDAPVEEIAAEAAPEPEVPAEVEVPAEEAAPAEEIAPVEATEAPAEEPAAE
jgi:large subunit ribosomal protein L10